MVLKPLSPKEVCEDQIKIREKLANERKSETLERKKKKTETLERKMRENEALESKQLYLEREMGGKEGALHKAAPLLIVFSKSDYKC